MKKRITSSAVDATVSNVDMANPPIDLTANVDPTDLMTEEGSDGSDNKRRMSTRLHHETQFYKPERKCSNTYISKLNVQVLCHSSVLFRP